MKTYFTVKKYDYFSREWKYLSRHATRKEAEEEARRLSRVYPSWRALWFREEEE